MSLDLGLAAIEKPPPAFHSGSAELDRWLARDTLQATRSGSARTHVATDGTGATVGYFALAAGEIQIRDADERIRKGMPRYPIPAVLLARLAVDRAAQGHGLGRELVWHAAALTLRASRLIAIRALVVTPSTSLPPVSTSTSASRV